MRIDVIRAVLTVESRCMTISADDAIKLIIRQDPEVILRIMASLGCSVPKVKSVSVLAMDATETDPVERYRAQAAEAEGFHKRGEIPFPGKNGPASTHRAAPPSTPPT